MNALTPRRLMVCATLVACRGTANLAGAGAPTDMLRGVFQDANVVLTDPATEQRPLDRLIAIRGLFSRVFDFRDAAERSLGRQWQARTAAEQQEFTRLFAHFVQRGFVYLLASVAAVDGHRRGGHSPPPVRPGYPRLLISPPPPSHPGPQRQRVPVPGACRPGRGRHLHPRARHPVRDSLIRAPEPAGSCHGAIQPEPPWSAMSSVTPPPSSDAKNSRLNGMFRDTRDLPGRQRMSGANGATEFTDVVGTLDELRALMGEPSEIALRKDIGRLDEHCRAFIARAPFVLVATADPAGRCDVSPKGDAPPSLLAVDALPLLLPDRPGNKRFDGMRNLLENPGIRL